MALPTKLSSNDVKGWAKGKLKAGSKNAVKAAKKKGKKGQPPQPGKMQAPADDPKKTQQPVTRQGTQDDQQQQQGQGHITVNIHSPTNHTPTSTQDDKPNTEPLDPMNAGGPAVPQEFLDDLRQDGDEDEDEGGVTDNPEIEEKLGDFAEVLEHRADELEELANEVTGDLSDEDPDMDTVREVQNLVPDDLKQELVEHLSALSDDEIQEFCESLQEQGKIEDADLVASFLRAASSDSSEDEDDDMSDEEDDTDDDEDEDEQDDDDSSDDDDEEDGDKPAAGKGKPPFAKGGGKKAPPFKKKAKKKGKGAPPKDPGDDDDEED
jgi:hypothetical protein